jgi:hypothetical protein
MGGVDSYTKILLHGDESPFVDSSNSAHTITNNNVVRSNTESKFGGYSMKFNGTNSYLATESHLDFDISSGDFTIDLWYWLQSGAKEHNMLIAIGTANYQIFGIYLRNHKVCMTYDITGGHPWDFTNYEGSHTAETPDTWHHIACVRNGNTFIMFVDGVIKYSHTQAADLVLNNYIFKVGCHYSFYGTYYFPGYIDEVRVSKGIARWTEDFTVPSSPYNSYIISGNTSVDSRIIVLNESDWAIDTNEEVTSGSYSVSTSSGTKTVIARSSDGECVGYGNVTPSS